MVHPSKGTLSIQCSSRPGTARKKRGGGCVCVLSVCAEKPLASIVTSLERNEGWTCPHHKTPLALKSVNDINV